MRKLSIALLGWGLFLCSCASSPYSELQRLAEEGDPLPYAVMIVGGAFVNGEQSASEAADPMARTFALANGEQEAFPLRELQEILSQGRVFVSTTTSSLAVDLRRQLAATSLAIPLANKELQEILQKTRNSGHDYLLVVEKIQDGAVQSQGINDRWPFTLGAWLFALGGLIPDRTYLSQAKLHVSLRDVYSGSRIYRVVVDAHPVNLNMFERSNVWGFLQSLIIPPFWTLEDEERLVESVRADAVQGLLVEVAKRMKSGEARGVLQQSSPAQITLQGTHRGLELVVSSAEAISLLRLCLDSTDLGPEVVSNFESSFIKSQKMQEDRFLYRAVLPPLSGSTLQVMLQTVAARIASVTFSL